MEYRINQSAVQLHSAELFLRSGYVVLRQVIDTADVYRYAISIKHKGMLNDPLVPGTPAFYKDRIFSDVQAALLATVERATGLPLFDTFNYFRIYKPGDVLSCHTDRPACEITGTLHLGGREVWPIFLLDRNEHEVAILLEAGDMLLYRGAELCHWRPRYAGEGDYVQAFFHFVDRNGAFADHRKDGRLALENGVQAILARKQASKIESS